MIDLKWLNRFPNQNLNDGLKILDELYWFISTGYKDNIWYVYAGHVLVFQTDSEEAYKAFLYGLAITYINYPSEIMDVFHKELKKMS